MTWRQRPPLFWVRTPLRTIRHLSHHLSACLSFHGSVCLARGLECSGHLRSVPPLPRPRPLGAGQPGGHPAPNGWRVQLPAGSGVAIQVLVVGRRRRGCWCLFTYSYWKALGPPGLHSSWVCVSEKDAERNLLCLSGAVFLPELCGVFLLFGFLFVYFVCLFVQATK